MIRTFISLAVAASAAVAAPAAATPRGEPFRVSIPTADLDLTSRAGQRALAQRARALAAQVCAPRPAAYNGASLRACRQSFDAAVRAAVAERTGGGSARVN